MSCAISLRKTRRQTAGFERRKLQSWREPVNLVEIILEIAAAEKSIPKAGRRCDQLRV
jgi:hypothetical protein